ncbi:MAG: SMC-Scp complex subunit ScpB [Myxococcales bacterium]|nr:SMC-Scp complex subunit ScpB [Myxococcales bacterium]MCB9644735.1 SMC-Scp complex subunit ScpB [Myxococcales bacterium]
MRQRAHHASALTGHSNWGFRSRQESALEALYGQIEALLFAANRPLSREDMRDILEHAGFSVLPEQIDSVLRELKNQYNHPMRGLRLENVAGGWQIRTRSEHAHLLQLLYEEKPPRLSRAALECLSIIAYRQPLTRAEIDVIRGVDSSGTLRSLLDRKLIARVGRSEDARRAYMYGTTHEFLEFFGLNDLRELPSVLNASSQKPQQEAASSEDEAIEAPQEPASKE